MFIRSALGIIYNNLALVHSHNFLRNYAANLEKCPLAMANINFATPGFFNAGDYGFSEMEYSGLCAL